MSRWLFPLGLILILFGVALAHWENRSRAPAEMIDSTRSPTRGTRSVSNGRTVAPAALMPQINSDGGRRYTSQSFLETQPAAPSLQQVWYRQPLLGQQLL